jgi:hypothetical protein
MTQNNTMNEYDNKLVEREPQMYQLEIKDIWTPNLAIAKYLFKPKRKFSIITDPDEEEYLKEDNEYTKILISLKDYLNNIVELEDRVILSSTNLKETLKPGDIIKTDFVYDDRPFKLNDNTTLFIFYAYKALYPKILVKKVKVSIFDPIFESIRPGDLLFFKIYAILRSADISFKALKNVWNYLSFDERQEYLNDISAITINLDKHYKEYIKNFFVYHFPFDEFNGLITKDIFDIKTILTLLDHLEPLRIIMKEKKIKGETKYVFDVKPQKGWNVFKDFELFKENVIKALGGNHPLIKAYFNYKLGSI